MSQCFNILISKSESSSAEGLRTGVLIQKGSQIPCRFNSCIYFNKEQTLAFIKSFLQHICSPYNFSVTLSGIIEYQKARL